MFTTKQCQYCASKIAYNACYCSKCKKEQINPNLAVEQFLKIQIGRYGIIILSLLMLALSLMASLGVWELSIVATYMAGVIVVAFIFHWVPVLLILQILPEAFLSYKIPYLTQRIQVCRRVMWRNVVLWLGATGLLISLQYRLYKTAPSEEQFSTFIKSTPYSEKDRLLQVYFPIGSIHAFQKDEIKGAYLGLWGKFISINPGIINEDSSLFAKHYKFIGNE